MNQLCEHELLDEGILVLIPISLSSPQFSLCVPLSPCVALSLLLWSQSLPKMDVSTGACDAYVKVALGGQQQQTQVVKGSRDPTWNEKESRVLVCACACSAFACSRCLGARMHVKIHF